MKKSVIGLVMFVMALGMIPSIQAGPVIVPVDPGPGGGGGGGRDFGINQNSNFQNEYDAGNGTWSGYAYGNFNGQFVVTDLSASLNIYPNPDPTPGNLGTFNFSMSGNGYAPKDPVTDPFVQLQLNNPLGIHNSWEVDRVEMHTDPKGGGQWLQFTPAMRVNGDTNSSIYLNTEPENFWFNSSLYSNVNVMGGAFTNASTNFEHNEWTGEGEPPEWFDELNFGFNASGTITAQNFSIVPEPASLALLATGGIATYRRRRRIA